MIISRGLVGPNCALNRSTGMGSRLIFRHYPGIRHDLTRPANWNKTVVLSKRDNSGENRNGENLDNTRMAPL
jgi:hypothetical protein